MYQVLLLYLPTPFWSTASFELAATTFDTSATFSLDSVTKSNKTNGIIPKVKKRRCHLGPSGD